MTALIRRRTGSDRLCAGTTGPLPSGMEGGESDLLGMARGPHVWGAGGNAGIDRARSRKPYNPGHADPRVVNAMHAANFGDMASGAPNRRGVEMVRLVRSGTEATMRALRLARAATGRDMVVMLRGRCHGHAASLLVVAGHGTPTLRLPVPPGVMRGATADTIVGASRAFAACAP